MFINLIAKPYTTTLPPIMKRTFCFTFFIVFFANSVFSQTEKIKELVEKTSELNLDMWDLTTYAEENIKDKEQLARFFYYWIGSNIEYDKGTYQKIVDGTIDNEIFWKSQEESVVYNTRKGVCAGYAKLYQWFLDWMDIETVVISGHIRDERNHYVELASDDVHRHAWNAIKINNKWMLVDTTWGTSNEESQSEFYFDIKPEHSIITHYPENSEWQLLKKPLSLEEFNNSKFIKPIWFFSGFSDIPKLKSDKDYYYFVFKNNPNKDWTVGLQFSIDNINFKPIPFIKPIVQDGYTYFRFKKSLIPKTAFFKVKIAEFKNTENSYSSKEYKDVINFKI
ncbi:hypothetical protein H7F37_02465 [Winogradskyella sp. PAMC22761]|nr:hypothetical protein H7F37_02465 [Winogradskyella sp. PAMC22761]